MEPYVRKFEERNTFNRRVREEIKKEIIRFNVKSKQDCFVMGQELGDMMRNIIEDLSVEHNYTKDMITKFIMGLRSSV